MNFHYVSNKKPRLSIKDSWIDKKWLHKSKKFIKAKNRDNSTKYLRKDGYNKYSHETKMIYEPFNQIKCFWCKHEVNHGFVKGFHGFVKCKSCTHWGCLNHFSSKKDANCCNKCTHEYSGRIHGFPKKNRGEWIDVISKSNWNYDGLFKYKDSDTCLWYKNVDPNLLKKLLQKKHEIDVVNSCKKIKLNQKKVIHYNTTWLKDMCKLYDNKYEKSQQKNLCNIYLDKKTTRVIPEVKWADIHQNTILCTKKLKLSDGNCDYGIKMIPKAIHPTVRARSYQWTQYIKHCIKRDSYVPYANPGTVTNHVMAFDGFYNFDPQLETVQLYNIENQFHPSKKAYQVII